MTISFYLRLISTQLLIQGFNNQCFKKVLLTVCKYLTDDKVCQTPGSCDRYGSLLSIAEVYFDSGFTVVRVVG